MTTSASINATFFMLLNFFFDVLIRYYVSVHFLFLHVFSITPACFLRCRLAQSVLLAQPTFPARRRCR